MNSHSPEIARQFSYEDIIFVENARTRGDEIMSVFRPVARTWRTSTPNGTTHASEPIDRQAVADFIGGSPIDDKLEQLEFEFGSAT